jgi:hypothetical protein
MFLRAALNLKIGILGMKIERSLPDMAIYPVLMRHPSLLRAQHHPILSRIGLAEANTGRNPVPRMG